MPIIDMYYFKILDLVLLSLALPWWIFIVHTDSFGFWFILQSLNREHRKFLKRYKNYCKALIQHKEQIAQKINRTPFAEEIQSKLSTTIQKIDLRLKDPTHVTIDDYIKCLNTDVYPNMVDIAFQIVLALVTRAEKDAILLETINDVPKIDRETFFSIIEAMTITIYTHPSILWTKEAKILNERLLLAAKYMVDNRGTEI